MVDRESLTIPLGFVTMTNVSGDRITQSSSAIPVDLIIDIFSRLPAKSIGRCRCVSKLWASILRRQDFTELFLSRSLTRPQLLFACQQRGDLFFFSLPQAQINSSSVAASVDQLTHFTFGYDCEIYGLLHGFVCLIYKWISKGRKQTAQMLCNPSTGQAIPLPKLNSSGFGRKTKSLFGYDPVDNQFKVLSMISSSYPGEKMMYDEFHVLTLGSENMSWRRIECCTPHYYRRPIQICVSGVLYYPSVNTSTGTYQIVCFDVSSEKFSFVKVEEALNSALVDGSLVDYNGRFGLLETDVLSSSFKLWVLEDLQKQEWSEHIFPTEWANIIRLAVLTFVGVTRANELMYSSYYLISPFYLFYFNLETKSILRVEIQGMDASKYNVLTPFINHVEDVKPM